MTTICMTRPLPHSDESPDSLCSEYNERLTHALDPLYPMPARFASSRSFKRALRDARPALGFAVLTAVTAALPQSHELRYYLYWMIVLVSLNLILASREGARVGLTPPALGAACALALSVVLAVTRCGYAYPSGSTFTELV